MREPHHSDPSHSAKTRSTRLCAFYIPGQGSVCTELSTVDDYLDHQMVIDVIYVICVISVIHVIYLTCSMM